MAATLNAPLLAADAGKKFKAASTLNMTYCTLVKNDGFHYASAVAAGVRSIFRQVSNLVRGVSK